MSNRTCSAALAIALVVAPFPALAIRGLQGTDPALIAEKCGPVRLPDGTGGWGYTTDADHKKACVAMGIADYCSANRTNTQDGTPVLIYDIDPPPPGNAPRYGVPFENWFEWDATSPVLYFEAGWRSFSPIGKTYGSPVCLSKKRWSTLPFNGTRCPDVLPDPRVDVQDPRARFCEDIAGVETIALEKNDLVALGVLRSAGALLFNKSAFLDAPLRVWTDHTGAYYTTSAGSDLGLRGHEAPVEAPGWVPEPLGTGETLRGVIISPNLHWLATHPDALPPSDPLRGLGSLAMVELVSYKIPGGFMTTIHAGDAAAAGGVAIRTEGWVLRAGDVGLAVAGGPGGVPPPVFSAAFAGTPKQLKRFGKCSPASAPGTCDPIYLTSTRRPLTAAGTPDTSWVLVRNEGFVLRGN